MIVKCKNIVARKIHDSFFLVDITEKYSDDKCSIYELNQTGMFIWNNINDGCSVDSLATALHSIIIDDVDYSIIFKDVQDYIRILKNNGFVSEV